MAFAKAHNTARRLLWGHNAHVGTKVSMYRPWIVEVDHLSGKVGAVVKKEVEVVRIPASVECLNKALILFLGGCNFEAENRAVVGSAYQLRPISFGRASPGASGATASR